MTFRDYINETEKNAKEYFEDWADGRKEDILDGTLDASVFMDSCFMSDYVTGNASGSYTFSTYKAQQNVAELIWDDEFIDALEMDFGESIGDCLKDGAEAVDVTARCLALSYIDMEEMFEEYIEENQPEDEEEEE